MIDSGLGPARASPRQAADIAKGNLAFVTIPTAGAETNSRGDVVLVDPAAVREFVDQRIAAQDARGRGGGAPGRRAPARRPTRVIHVALRRGRPQRRRAPTASPARS